MNLIWTQWFVLYWLPLVISLHHQEKRKYRLIYWSTGTKLREKHRQMKRNGTPTDKIGILHFTLKSKLVIDGVALQLLEPYLSERSQCVLIDGIPFPNTEASIRLCASRVCSGSTPVLYVLDGTYRYHSKA